MKAGLRRQTENPIEAIISPSLTNGEVTPCCISRKRSRGGVSSRRPAAAGSFVPSRSDSAPVMGENNVGRAKIRNNEADVAALKPNVSWT